MSEFLQRLQNEFQLRRLLPRGQKILVAVSGGLDSMVLWYALEKLAAENRWQIVVAHFNHQMRGRSSDADEKLVRKTAAVFKRLVVVGQADVKAFAQSSKLSIEMAARKLRHEFLARTAREQKISVVALAHHADDQVEQFFLRLLRGAGGGGLAGMKWRSPSPVNAKIELIRPLLNLSKAELHEFARRNKICFREDATNARNDVGRNRIRNELLPLLRKYYQPGLEKTVLRLMDIVGAESEAIGVLAAQWLNQPQSTFADLSIAVQRRILEAQIVSLGLLVDFELIESLRRSEDSAVSISPEFSISRDAAGKVRLNKLARVAFKADERIVNLNGRTGETAFSNVRIDWNFDAPQKKQRHQRHTNQEFFDAGKVGGQIMLRHWRSGDRFQPIGLKSSAKLQDLFMNAKIPRAQRHDLIVATTADGQIFWVEGLRISENFKLDSQTKQCLVWCWCRP